MNKLFLYLLPVLPLVSCDKEDAQEIVFFPEIPIVNEEYVTITMSGFTVNIRENEYGKTTAKNALTQLRSDLEEIETLFSKDVIDKMKTNPIWVERNINDGAAWYHADKQWLIDNAMNPEKSKCVEISNYVN